VVVVAAAAVVKLVLAEALCPLYAEFANKVTVTE
jgi:hypothetical protein